ncbi:centrosomal protein of 97 kDa [Solea senegalensis]|uniref:Centrosomal protein of 97 kDa n=3 Tax=Solea senegalensis TaxID=28829 RepID=A0AAV6R9C4_SOLSE|nr:centrosomal protein of 97 kDa [Solea senegalensis]KAG7501650.1 centrosomal protein of 97 kDa [Solea senegalensis]
MGVSDLKFDTNAGPVVDLSAQGLQKLDPTFTCSEDTHTLILDRNHIMKLDHLERSPGLQQLSVANNRLVRMMGVSRLMELRVLNLPNNSIGYIEGLRDLPHLKWLNLSGNNIKVIEQLSSCVSLQHLDLSDNNITAIGDITKLVALKTLLLHGNSITTLRTVPAHLPVHLSILSLAENEIRDLNEASYLAPLHELEQLSIMSNPCVMATPSLPGFDYRPYIMSWCLNLKVLDGYVVSQKEGLKAEWLYSQGKGRSYRPGQHVQLVQYLATVCPLTSSPALETAEDAKLEKILSKQRFHQMQLLEETERDANCPSPPRPTHLDVEKHSPPDAALQGGNREVKINTAAGPTDAPSVTEKEPSVQFNTWVSCDSSHTSLPTVRSPRLREEQIYLEDVQTDEEKLNDSLLSSESTFLPFPSHLEPQTTHSDSEDETETFEPDSLAPQRPAQPKKQSTNKPQQHSPTVDKQHRKTPEEEVTSSASTTVLSPGFRVSTPLNDLDTSSNSGKVEMKEAPKQEDTGLCVSKSSLMEAEKAAVKIQSWWKGHYTRWCHPMAREVRSEIRLRRMQEHILYLSEKLGSVQRQYEEERLQRLVQEEAVKFLWKELQSMQQWKTSVEQQLANMTQVVAVAQVSSPGPCKASPPVASSTKNPPSTDVSFPDSGFQSTSNQPSVQDDSFLSSGTEDSLKTVRALSPVRSGVDSSDCSLLEQYLSSVQQREEEAEEAVSDRTETPQLSSPVCSGETAQSGSPAQKVEDGVERTDGGGLSPV